MKKTLSKALESGLRYFENIDMPDIQKVGCFTEIEALNQVREFEVNFPAAFVLHLLSFFDDSYLSAKLVKLKNDLIEFLSSEIDLGSVNYFTKEFIPVSEFKLPDDLDDTALVLSALFKHNVPIHENAILKIIPLESKPGGPYITWYVDKSKLDKDDWRVDIDPVVNAHLMYLMALLKIDLENTRTFLRKSLKEKKISSPYYPSGFFFYFYLSKYISVKNDRVLKREILKNLELINFKDLNKLEKVLYGLTLNYLGRKLKHEELKEILSFQEEDGSVKQFGFCYDYTWQGKKTFTTNTSATTAVWLELVVLELLKLTGVKKITKEDNMVKLFIDKCRKQIEAELLSNSFAKKTLKIFPVEKATKPILIPLFIAQDLLIDFEKDLDKLVNLSVAAYFGWVAYTIFDNTIDTNESIEDLPLVNFLMMLQHVYSFKIVSGNRKLEHLIKQAHLETDENYHWEITEAKIQKKLPKDFDYSYIEKRMKVFLAFLSQMPIIFNLTDSSKVIDSIYSILASIMIIDQMNDDLEDWKIDLEQNILTFVTYNVLKKAKASKDYDTVYWNIVVPQILKICKNVYFDSLKVLGESEIKLNNLKNMLERSYAKTLKAEVEYKKIQNLMKHYVK